MDLKEYIERFDTATRGLNQFKKQFLLKQAISIRNEAQRRTPVDTGALKASWYVGNEKFELQANRKGKITKKTISEADIRSVGRKMSVVIGNGQEYASFIEYGTRNEDESQRIKPFNMISVPIQRYQRNGYKRFNTALRKYLKEKGID